MDVSKPSSHVRQTLQDFLKRSLLYDPWRCMHASERDFTYFSSPHGSYSRINLFLTDLSLLHKVLKSEIMNITWSDHAPIKLTLTKNHRAFPTRLLRNNAFLFKNKKCRERLNVQLEEFFQFNLTP